MKKTLGILLLVFLSNTFQIYAQTKVKPKSLLEKPDREIAGDRTSWFAKSLEFRGIAVKDDNWQIWGCSPILGPEGKTHLFVARWPEETGHEGWYTHSQIAHYVGDTSQGPFKFSDIVLEGTGRDTWDKFAPHNPAIHKVGDTYALFYIANTGTKQRPSNQKIGLATSKSLYGPWKKVGKDGLILSPPTDSTFYNYGTTNGVNNPAFLQHPDGRFFLYFKSNDMRKKDHWKPMMGLAIADKLEGPYKQLPNSITQNNSVIEDGYAFNYGNKICLVTTDNHGMIENGGGLIWESQDGISFANPKQAFKRLAHYFGGTLPEKSHQTKGDRGSKFERPQILMIDGKPSWLYAPSGTNTDGGKGSAGYVLKIKEEFLPGDVKEHRNLSKLETSLPGNRYSWASLKRHPVPKWFDDAKFGIFIHWGPYSVIGYTKGGRGYAEHVPKNMYREPKHYYPYIEEMFGSQPPEFGYKDVIPLFKAEKWDPEKWAELFQKAGAKYVILTAEHHDGYALWDSDLTEWCAAKIGPMRDLVGDLGKAVRAKGMKYAPSYHRERHTGFFAQEKYSIKSPPHPDIAEEIARMPKAADLYGPFEYSDAFIENYVARWKEIEMKYKPDFMWIDDVPIFYWTDESRNHPQTQKFKEAYMYMIGDYFNAAEEWGKEVYLNNKGKHKNWPDGPGCLEKDNLKLETIGPKWQNPATLGTSYGYMKAEEENDAYKSPTELIHLLCDVVSKNGNLLLNIGPRADGTIPEGMKKRLLAIGEWLEINGEAIYGTRPWVTYKQDEPNLRFTAKPDVFYAIALEKPSTPFVIQLSDSWDIKSVKSVSLLASDKEIKWIPEGNSIKIFPPNEIKGEHAWVVKIVKISDQRQCMPVEK